MLSGTEAAMAPAEYTVIAQGQRFQLSRAQLEFDSPNLLSEYFLNNKYESGPSPREIKLSRNPGLFLLVLEYLCGYKILPINHNAMPIRMSPENVLDNLRADAIYYNLQGLVRLIDTYAKSETACVPNATDNTLPTEKSPPIFHFPGRVVNWSRAENGRTPPSGYIEFPVSIDLSKNFSITCWFKAASNKGWHTLIALEVPTAPHSLFYVSISPAGDFQFEVGIGGATSPSRLHSGRNGPEVHLGVWTHLAFVQRVNQAGQVDWRKLYLGGKETVSSDANSALYNPSPEKTRMAIMRGVWNHNRNAGFLGQAENIAVFQHALSEDEIITRALRSTPPADSGWQTEANGVSGRAY